MNQQPTYSFDIWEALIRILKYAIEAVVVANAGIILPALSLTFTQSKQSNL